MVKKIIISLCLSFYVLTSLFSPKVAFAQAEQLPPWYHQDYVNWLLRVFDDNDTEIFGERYTYAQVRWIIYSLYTNILTLFVNENQLKDFVDCLATADTNKCLQTIIGDATINSDYQDNPTLLANLGFVFNDERPISAITYTKQVARKLTLIPEAKAQTPVNAGIGYQALQLVHNLWVQARNVSYSIFALAMIVVAFMIMFRVKLSPQTVISVYSALPKLAITLVLVVFSYAIAGLLIDLMYLVIGIVATLFNQDIRLLIIGPEGNLFTGILGMLFLYGQLMIAVIVTMFSVAGGLALILILVFIILILLFIFVAFRIAFSMVKAFTMILLLTIFAPIQFVAGVVIPGMGFGAWLKNYVSNLAIFPVVGLLFVLAFNFMGAAITSIHDLIYSRGINADAATYQPIDGWPPLLNFGPEWTPFLMVVVSLVVLSIIPKATELISSIVSGRPFAYGMAIGEALGPVKGGLGLGSAALTPKLSAIETEARQANLSPFQYQKSYGAIKGAQEVLRQLSRKR